MKPVLLTGATRGLGLAIARALLGSDDYALVATGRAATPELSALIEAAPGRCRFLPADLSDLDAIPGLVAAASPPAAPLYALINNAGEPGDGAFLTLHAAAIRRTVDVNLVAPMLLARHAARPMIRRRGGRIVNITSIAAATGFKGLSAYGASKAGLAGLARGLSRELGPLGITVNNVAPGYLETRMTDGLVGETAERIRRRTSVGLAHVADVAAAVLYLLSPAAGKITGTTITVDGGSTA